MTMSDLIALFSEIRQFLERRKSSQNARELLAVRAALKELYFGEKTLEAVEEARGGNLSKATIALSDSGKPVRDALDKLQLIAREEGCSIRLQELITHVGYEKISIRETLMMSLYFSEQKSSDEWDELLAQIDAINAQIEELDILIGGLRILNL